MTSPIRPYRCTGVTAAGAACDNIVTPPEEACEPCTASAASAAPGHAVTLEPATTVPTNTDRAASGHALRRQVAVQLVLDGGDLAAVARLLGHRSPTLSGYRRSALRFTESPYDIAQTNNEGA